MSGAQRAAFQEISLEMAAHGWLCKKRGDNQLCMNSVLNNVCGDAPAEENNNGVTFRRDETKHKNVFAAAIVALGRCLAQRALCVQDDLLMLGTDEVIDDV
jgi:hypothetical protein